VRTPDGRAWTATPVQLTAPDLYRVAFSEPTTISEIALLPCGNATADCAVDALTLVDARDGTFSSLTMPPYRLIFSGDVKIYENLSVLPRAFLVGGWRWVPDSPAAVAAMRDEAFDPAQSAVVIGDGTDAAPATAGVGSAAILDYTPESIRLRAAVEQDALLVLADAFYPGWLATVDGQAEKVVMVDGMFRGLFLPEGEHEVVFHYRPRSFRVGTVATLAGVVLTVLIAVWSSRSRRDGG
jgi:hypothetical protein